MMLADTIQQKIQSLTPSYLDVVNESHKHNVPKDSETHFKLVIVSEEFEGQSLVNRHRMVNKLLSEELAGGVHALSLQTMTAAEWQEKGGSVRDTPECLGGDR